MRLVPVVVLLLLLLASLALAHAELRSSIPKAGSTIKDMPTAVQILFTEAVEVKLSTFKVYRIQAGPEALKNPAQVRSMARSLFNQVLLSKNDTAKRWDNELKTLARTSKSITLGLKPGLKAGAYVVMWQNLSTDGHRERDFFVFTYAPR